MRLLPLIFFTLLSSVVAAHPPNQGSSWGEVQQNKKGKIVIYWYESTPFTWNANGTMTGIEADIMAGFTHYLKNNYHIDLTIEWRQGKSFVDTYNSVRDSKEQGVFGAATFSITPERKQEIGFSPPYMPDISILISSKNIPIVKDVHEFDRVFSNLQAITVKGTTYENDLLMLKKERNIDFKIKYIPVDYVIEQVQKADSSFGFITLPNYLTVMNKKAELSITRQNLFPSKREGYAIIYPLQSDWAEPIHEYFTSTHFHSLTKEIIDRYFENNVYEFIENLFYNASDVSLLIHEKEVQQRDLLSKNKQIELEAQLRNYLTAGIILTLSFLIIIYVLYQRQSQANKILQQQKLEIESQRLNIKNQNKELETQNSKLVRLNEEKNYLIKVLAHDLRAPLNHIRGLAEIFLLENPTLANEQKQLVLTIIESANRLTTMIGKILDVDAVENERVNLTLERVNLRALLEKVMTQFEKNASQKSIQLLVANNQSELTVMADQVYLTEIIENLVSNALKFSERDKTVEAKIIDNTATVILCIKDEGPGLTAEDKLKVFQKFQKLSATTTDGEPSTGLGLSIVKKYAELMNGKVWCESEHGKGAMFCVELPKA